VPDRWISSHPRSIAACNPATYSSGLPPAFKKGQLIDRIGDLDQLTGGFFRVGVGAIGGEFHLGTSNRYDPASRG
jgi:hypothetical protein